MKNLKHFRVAYEERLWIPGHGCNIRRLFDDIYAWDMKHALGKWTVKQLKNQSLICITEQP